ncbi:MAG: hypothetical protein NTZ17_01785 [Phycisphaerae bacterium]|nr:hypothetical protein [Phycisphaerae bacterium]
MKRILLCAVVLAFMPGITQAYGYGYGGVHYSPYALSYYHSGLVPCGVEYTPYALSYYNSGLVAGYGVYSGGYADYGFPLFGVHCRPAAYVVRAPQPVRHSAQNVSRPAQPRPGTCRTDGMDVIRQRLRARGFASVSIDRILRIDDQLVSVDVFVKDRNLLIKYWNPAEVANLNAKEVSKQRAYAQYKQNWEQFAETYKQTGGEVYTVSASEPQTIVAALDSCTRLSPDNGIQPTVMYAKN